MNNDEKIILLVEDDSNDTLLLQRAFRRAGLTHTLRVVTDGDEAVSYLKGEEKFSNRESFPVPSLLLLDLKLPRRSGLEVLAWVRKEAPPGLRTLPVIVLTSSRLSEDVDQAYTLGANSYMAKPSGNYEGLVEMVKALEKANEKKV